ncbi:MAG: hypothetical protein AAF088_06835 [Pseudomonadota bacterium]
MADTYSIYPVLTDDDLHVWAHRGHSRRLVICFSGIGVNSDAVQPYEFARAATAGGRDNVLFISDPHRTWLNGPGLIEKITGVIETEAELIGADQVVTLGHSMGGFSAAIMPAFTRVDVAVCLSPQATVHPSIATDDSRWMDYRARIETHRLRSVGDHIVPDTMYFAFFGMHGREVPQRNRFPRGPNIKFFLMPRTVHNTPQRMKQAGILDEIVQFAFDRRSRMVRRILRTELNARQERATAEPVAVSADVADLSERIEP